MLYGPVWLGMIGCILFTSFDLIPATTFSNAAFTAPCGQTLAPASRTLVLSVSQRTRDLVHWERLLDVRLVAEFISCALALVNRLLNLSAAMSVWPGWISWAAWSGGPGFVQVSVVLPSFLWFQELTAPLAFFLSFLPSFSNDGVSLSISRAFPGPYHDCLSGLGLAYPYMRRSYRSRRRGAAVQQFRRKVPCDRAPRRRQLPRVPRNRRRSAHALRNFWRGLSAIGLRERCAVPAVGGRLPRQLRGWAPPPLLTWCLAPCHFPFLRAFSASCGRSSLQPVVHCAGTVCDLSRGYVGGIPSASLAGAWAPFNATFVPSVDVVNVCIMQHGTGSTVVSNLIVRQVQLVGTPRTSRKALPPACPRISPLHPRRCA